MNKRTLFKQIILLMCLLGIISSWAVQAQEGMSLLSLQDAYEKGKLLHWQYKEEQAKSYLKYAADKGHIEAAFMYSEILSQPSFVQNEEESKYAVMAAESGHLLALLKVSIGTSMIKRDWRVKAEQLLLNQAQLGNSDAMRYLYSFYPDSDDRSYYWLKKASESGNPKAMFMLAERYEGQYGWFIIPGSREKEILRLYKASAEAGYPPAMDAYSFSLERKPETRKEAVFWILKGVEAGQAMALLIAAELYSSDGDLRDVMPYDSVKAAAYYHCYFANMAKIEKKRATYDYYYELYQDLLSTMTESEILQAEELAKNYLSTHTVRAFDEFWEWGVDYGVRPEIK
ncbi:hypothetical protein L3Q72_05570 [Vibrio sp. JC009]|uniref:tetratricopeptide repeat protein n=1 Tax=Vibrio sp. JC009 TaxID=2912314 RepID=UPI0023B08958|nr:hypothetical protein [Vibrio sp. JC009]WED22862.1 hypothetical protein L3Q72_05570 [Vibrio sp. JC009]